MRSAGGGDQSADRPVTPTLQGQAARGRAVREVDVTRDRGLTAGAVRQRGGSVARQRPPSEGIAVTVTPVENQGGSIGSRPTQQGGGSEGLVHGRRTQAESSRHVVVDEDITGGVVTETKVTRREAGKIVGANFQRTVVQVDRRRGVIRA